MKVLLCHSFYQHRGGEDESFTAEKKLLEAFGHEVITYTRHNKEIPNMVKVAVAQRAIWNHGAYRDMRRLIRAHQPEVMHCTNTFPIISPSVYYAARAEGVAVVQSLRNYRLQCLNGQFFRNERICVKCPTSGSTLPGVLHGCYRKSRAASAAVATMLVAHRTLGTWRNAVDLYVAPTQFAADQILGNGVRAEKVVVKPNFVSPDPGPGTGNGGYAMFAGRLSPEKGLRTLMAAWEGLDAHVPLKVVGDGKLLKPIEEVSRHRNDVEVVGRRPLKSVYALLGEAALLVMPSEWYETFGRIIAEAFAKGTPVVAARHGAMAELVDDGRTGLLFEPGNAGDLAKKVEWLWAHPAERAMMRRATREEFEQKYTAARNHELLMAIYEQARLNYRTSAKRPKGRSRSAGDEASLDDRSAKSVPSGGLQV